MSTFHFNIGQMGKGLLAILKKCSKLHLFDLKENNKKEEIRETFKAFDKEDTGYINAKELKMVMTNLGLKITNEEIQEMMKFANLDDEADQLSFEEFAQMMTKIM